MVDTESSGGARKKLDLPGIFPYTLRQWFSIYSGLFGDLLGNGETIVQRLPVLTLR